MTAADIVLLLVLLGYIVSGIDDLAFDLYYWVESARPSRHPPPLEQEELEREPELNVAVITGAWDEGDVLEDLLVHNYSRLRYREYDVFVGTYPNDPATQRAVDAAAARIPHIHKVVGPEPGPTTKADSLNACLLEIVRREALGDFRYDVVLVHDAEDLIHPLELLVLNHRFREAPGVGMIQLPVHPLPVHARDFTAGTYVDEFAEVHTKDLLVRQWTGGFVPSAGVATAFRRSAVDRLWEAAGGAFPFSPGSLTEDYDVGIQLAMLNVPTEFLRRFVERDAADLTEHAIRPRWFEPVRREAVADAAPHRAVELVATRAEFPHHVRASVRQRSRWTLGIVFQNWMKWGWVGPLVMRWQLFHDRKGPWSYTVVVLGYALALTVFAYDMVRLFFAPELPRALSPNPLTGTAITIGMTLMLQRALQRAIATGRIHGWREAALAVLRIPWSNLVNSAATFRAARRFASARLGRRELAWEKTAHRVPPALRKAA